MNTTRATLSARIGLWMATCRASYLWRSYMVRRKMMIVDASWMRSGPRWELSMGSLEDSSACCPSPAQSDILRIRVCFLYSCQKN